MRTKASLLKIWMLALCLGLAIISGFALSAAAATAQDFEIAGLKVTAWLPQGAAAQGAPVILFSHGFHGCAKQSTFLTEALADAGYAVFAPNHRDVACGNLAAWFGAAEAPFLDTDRWTEATYADRAMDLKALIDAASRDPRFAAFDWGRIGLAGHSLGGYTVLGLGGGWTGWKDARVRAVLALSPYSAPFLYRQTLSGLSVPVMYQGGTWDVGITPLVGQGGGAYDQTPAPKYYVELEGAGHFAWTDLNPRFHEAINAYSIAFFDAYLKDKPFPDALLRKGKQVSDIRMQMN